MYSGVSSKSSDSCITVFFTDLENRQRGYSSPVEVRAPTNWIRIEVTEKPHSRFVPARKGTSSLLRMTDQLKIEIQADSNSDLLYEYDSLSSNSSRCGSLKYLLTAEKESFFKEILFAQAMFPEFFVRTAWKDVCTDISQTSLLHVVKRASTVKKRPFSLADEAIETWYIKEYGLLTS